MSFESESETWSSQIDSPEEDLTIKKIPKDKKTVSKWVLWAHSLASKDWSIEGYDRLYEIEYISQFWRVFNNLNRLGLETHHLYLMKDGVTPMWEDDKNRNGGIFSIKVEFDRASSQFEELAVYLVTENITEQTQYSSDITGISFSPKINPRFSFAILKIWNSDSNNDVSRTLSKTLKKKYQKQNTQYKVNTPEY